MKKNLNKDNKKKCDNLKTQIVTELRTSNCEKTKDLNFDKTQKNCGNSTTEFVTKTKLGENSKTPIITKQNKKTFKW